MKEVESSLSNALRCISNTYVICDGISTKKMRWRRYNAVDYYNFNYGHCNTIWETRLKRNPTKYCYLK